jgi:hypothetical protein
LFPEPHPANAAIAATIPAETHLLNPPSPYLATASSTNTLRQPARTRQPPKLYHPGNRKIYS